MENQKLSKNEMQKVFGGLPPGGEATNPNKRTGYRCSFL
jgi:hypothetical protein